jgi:hypothetical protein
MNQNPQATNDQILYAQALQIAIQLSGNTNTKNPLPTAFPHDLFVEKDLEKYRALTLSILRYLHGQ